MNESHTLYVSYSQLAVFCEDVPQPFNDWTDAHVLQGFSWRSESVSFKTLNPDGDIDVTVRIADQHEIRSDTVRAMRVPFSVADGCTLEIATITEGFNTNIPAGHYALVFETGTTLVDAMWCILTFVSNGPQEPLILRADKDLQPAYPLVMKASPAG